MIGDLLYRCEAFAKGLAFGCKSCGQCVLTSTRLVCPMGCAKGLRNGPCGGTTDGRCEVHREKACTWVRIHGRRHGERLEAPPILPATDPGLHHTASYWNLLTGADRSGRKALPALATGERDGEPPRTESLLERRLRAGRFVVTTEVRAPRTARDGALRRQARALAGAFDAVNATAFLGGRPGLPSIDVAGILVEEGVEAIGQATGRDCTRPGFVGDLLAASRRGVRNCLCLTGDAYPGAPGVRGTFDADASLLLYEARHLRERGRTFCTDEPIDPPPRPFLGCAANPMSTPRSTAVRRLWQKADAGAEFVQSQCILAPEVLTGFLAAYRQAGLHRRLWFLAGIPVITSRKALDHLATVPGIVVPEGLVERFASGDPAATGIALARELVAAARAEPGCDGVHLMLFGRDHEALLAVRQEAADIDAIHREKPVLEPIPCPIP